MAQIGNSENAAVQPVMPQRKWWQRLSLWVIPALIAQGWLLYQAGYLLTTDKIFEPKAPYRLSCAQIANNYKYYEANPNAVTRDQAIQAFAVSRDNDIGAVIGYLKVSGFILTGVSNTNFPDTLLKFTKFGGYRYCRFIEGINTGDFKDRARIFIGIDHNIKYRGVLAEDSYGKLSYVND